MSNKVCNIIESAYGVMLTGGHPTVPYSSGPPSIERDYASFQIANGGKTFCASELAGIEPTPHTPEEQGMFSFAN
jgi:hypothetical protein